MSVTTILLIYLMYSTFTSTLSLATCETSSCHLINFFVLFHADSYTQKQPKVDKNRFDQHERERLL